MCSHRVSFHAVDVINDFGQNGGFDILLKKFNDDLKHNRKSDYKYVEFKRQVVSSIAQVEFEYIIYICLFC